MESHTDVTIGVHQPSVVKWITLLLTTVIVLTAIYAFYLSKKEGFWLGIFMALIFYSITLYNTILVSNISLTSKGILVENLFTSKQYNYSVYRKTISFIPGYSKIYFQNTRYFFRNHNNPFTPVYPSESLKSHEQIMNHIKRLNIIMLNNTA